MTTSDISIRFWVYDTSTAPIVPNISTGGCLVGLNGNPSCFHQVTGVTATATAVSPSCGSDASHQANWEITISNTDNTPLPAGATWSNIQAALHLASYGNFAPGTGDWYSGCRADHQYASDPHYGVYFKGDLVFASGIAAPACRAPHGQQQLQGYRTAPASNAPVVGAPAQDRVIALAVGLPVQDMNALENMVHDVSDPSSASYRQYLDPDAFASTFAPSVSDYHALESWAQSTNLSAVATYPNRMLLDVAGTVAQLEQALFVNIVSGLRPDGTIFFELDREPSLNLAVPVLRISGLDNFALPHPMGGGTTPSGRFQSSDLRNAYAQGCLGLTGAGQSIGLFEMDAFVSSDITTYETLTSLPSVSVTTVPINGFSQTPGDGQDEVTGDIELAMAMAPNASIVVFEGSSSNDILNNMATRLPLSRQLSSSWGNFDVDANSQQIIDEFAVQGQTYFLATGDIGAFTENPADNSSLGTNDAESNLTLVGSTVLTMDPAGTTWSSETTASFSSGGIEVSIPIPDFQQGLDMTQNLGSTVFRNAPDVSIVGTGLDFVLGGTRHNFAGTSASAPLWAGFTALVNEQNANNGLRPLGYANRVIYAIGKTALQPAPNPYSLSFHDIQDGSRNPPNGMGAGGFPAVAGYDLATGWGTPTCGLINQLASPSPLTVASFTELEFLISTGTDDLRGDSEARANVTFSDPTTPPMTLVLKSQAANAWNEGSVHHLLFALPTPQAANGIASVTLTLIQHGSFPETDDNWNVESLDVRLVNPSGPEQCVIDKDGDPVVRFTGTTDGGANGPDFTLPSGAGCPGGRPPAVPSANVTTVDLLITTGADDLRDDSEAQATIFFSGPMAPAPQTFELKSQSDPEWFSGAVHDIPLVLASPVPFTAIDHIDVTLIQHGSFPETDDNWNIQGMDIQTFTPGDLQHCFTSVSGDDSAPAVRLTATTSGGSNGPTARFAGGGCP